MGEALALEVDRFHLQLDPGMGMMESLVVEGLDLLGCEVDVDHRRGPHGASWGNASCDELTACTSPIQSSSLGREQYKRLHLRANHHRSLSLSFCTCNCGH